jgi:type II secretory pathway pseudopilin PulG
MQQKLKKNGQTLIEILIAIAVVVLVLVAVVSRVVDAVGNANFARNQLLSTRFAQEGIEWTRSQRDRLGWDEFVFALDSDPVTYCVLDLSTNPNLEDLTSGTCAGVIPGTLFDREIDIDYTDVGDPSIGDYVEVTVAVSWQDRIGDHSTVLSTRLSDWTK